MMKTVPAQISTTVISAQQCRVDRLEMTRHCEECSLRRSKPGFGFSFYFEFSKVKAWFASSLKSAPRNDASSRGGNGKNIQSGFTLIEILVALVILAIVGSMTVVGLQSAIRAQKIVSAHQDRLAEVQTAILILERDIAQIINRPILSESGSLPALMVRYSGGRLILEFTRSGYINPFGVINRSTLQRVNYSSDGKFLWRRTWQTLDRIPGENPIPQKILSGVTDFSVQFLDDKHRWLTPGDSSTMNVVAAIPLAIRVNLLVDDIGMITRVIPLAGG